MPSKAKRMQICAACYQFSLFSLSPWNYKSVVPTALFIPSVTAGDNYVQEACRGRILGTARKWDADPSFKKCHILQKVEGVPSGHRGLSGVPSWSPTPAPAPQTPPRSAEISQNKTLRWKGWMWWGRVKKDESSWENEKQLCLRPRLTPTVLWWPERSHFKMGK